MALEGVYKSYRNKADQVDWKKYNQNELFRLCIEHENDELYENYFAGIVCRFWGYLGRIYSQCNGHVPIDDCLDCIIDAIRYVLKKRVWERPDSSLYNDQSGPDKAIHIAMKRQKAIMLSKLSAQRRMTNFNTMSLDEAYENYKDSTDGMLFDMSSNDDTSIRSYISSMYNNEDNYLLGTTLDIICFSGMDKFDSQSVVKELKSLDMTSYEYYKTNYDAKEKPFVKMIIEIRDSSNKYLEVKIKSMLYKLRGEYDENK